MNVLIACEESQVECLAFRSLGHVAYSCDLVPCTGGHPEWHIQGDCLDIINDSFWDLVIAHPPCTFLSNAGARWLYPCGVLNSDRYFLGLKAKDFFYQIYNSSCSRLCIENPVPSKVFNLPPPSQIIQPFMFGEPYSKKTCLWLRGLPILMATDIVCDFKPYISTRSFSGFSRSGGSSRIRSRSFVGIASAMASQWT